MYDACRETWLASEKQYILVSVSPSCIRLSEMSVPGVSCQGVSQDT
jgi:hypothetical protein